MGGEGEKTSDDDDDDDDASLRWRGRPEVAWSKAPTDHHSEGRHRHSEMPCAAAGFSLVEKKKKKMHESGLSPWAHYLSACT